MSVQVGGVYIIECFGDLARDNVLAKTACSSLSEALALIARTFPGWQPEAPLSGVDNLTLYPDPEDDRIVVWYALAGTPVKVVWHFSGWHWEHQAEDLEGGPLPQGILPGDDCSMYEIAMKGY